MSYTTQFLKIDSVKLRSQKNYLPCVWSRMIQSNVDYRQTVFYMGFTRSTNKKNTLNLWFGKPGITFAPQERILLQPFYEEPIIIDREIQRFDNISVKIPTAWKRDGKPNSNEFLDLSFEVSRDKSVYYILADNGQADSEKLFTMFGLFALLGDKS